MATVRREIPTAARPEQVWDAIRDIGALHTRLVPGFVTDTRLEPAPRRAQGAGGEPSQACARIVTFANGRVVREPIVALDDEQRRLVWTAEGVATSHFNASAQVFAEGTGARVVWTADLLPDSAAAAIGAMMTQGATAMKRALDRLAAGT